MLLLDLHFDRAVDILVTICNIGAITFCYHAILNVSQVMDGVRKPFSFKQ